MSRRTDSANRNDPGRAEQWMGTAIEIAVDSKPHPNPRVGAVMVAPGGELVSSGVHSGPGSPHAEALALAAAGDRAQGATLVVTLEPCNHHGRTPPCTDAILNAGVSTVVVGTLDPDARVRGEGIARLRDAGVTVVELGDPAARDLDPGYFHHRETGLPRVTLKTAVTLDGQTAARDGTSQWITSPAAREDAHRLRAASDAVMVGAGTLLADDPRLDVRLLEPGGPQPRPVVVAGRRELPVTARLFARDPIVYTTRPKELPGAEVIVVGGTGGGDMVSGHDTVDLGGALKDLGARNIVDLLVEGGPTLAAGLWSAGFVDRVVFYVGAKLAGGVGRGVFGGVFETLGDAWDVTITDVVRVGDGLRIEAIPLEGEA